jgi:membrane-associated phospholipid phosphatase
MPLLILLLVALAAGLVVLVTALRFPAATRDPAAAAGGGAAEEIASSARRHPWLRELLRGRLNPEAATGLALTLALAVAIAGGLLMGLLALLMRSSGHLVAIDRSVGRWAHDHAAPWSTQGLQLVTDLASTPAAAAVLLVVIAAESIRAPNRWVAPFLLTVIVGEVILVDSIKKLLHRARPTFTPITEHLGPSFPSGHSATAAALYAGVALVLSRRRSPHTRALLAAGAVAIAVAVACSRVMLDVHWMSDVVAGLAFGWAWFSICAIAFGGRFLSFGAPVERASRATPPAEAGRRGSDVVEVALQRAEHPAAPARDSR